MTVLELDDYARIEKALVSKIDSAQYTKDSLPRIPQEHRDRDKAVFADLLRELNAEMRADKVTLDKISELANEAQMVYNAKLHAKMLVDSRPDQRAVGPIDREE